MMMRFHISICGLLIVLLAGGCARPSLESVVYRNFGAGAIILPGHNAAPVRSPRYLDNNYNYPPGTLLRRVSYTSPDPVNGRAGVFANGLKFCRQFSIFLSGTIESRFNDIEETSDFSLSLFGRTLAIRQFVDELGFPNIPDQTLAWIDYASLKLKNVRSYEVNDSQLLSITADHVRRGRCRIEGFRDNDPYTHIVRRIFVADIEADVVIKKGASARVLGLRAALVQAMTSRLRGRRIIFAMSINGYQQSPFVALRR
jgi:hypothetical protein